MEDLATVLDFSPEVLIVGQGAEGMMSVPEELRKALAQQGIDLKVCKTAEAVAGFNALPQNTKAVAALHLTC
jgi:hypothetical protein